MQWTSPDTLIPDPYNPLDWNRYAYARYNPLRFSDPSGHSPCDVAGADPECKGLHINRRSTPTVIPTLQPTPTPTTTPTLPPTFSRPQNVPYWAVPSTPTPNIPQLYPGPTNTLTPTIPPTIIKKPDGTYTWVDWGNLIDKQKVDGWDLLIDIVGAGGQIVGYVGGPIGKGAFVVSEVAEGLGAGKATVDLFGGKPANFSMLTAQKVAPVAIDWLRVHPDAGIIFNFISIGINVGPAVNMDAIHIVRGE